MHAAVQISPAERYRQFGDNIPPLETLLDLYKDLEREDNPYSIATKAHVCIDIASAHGPDGKYRRWLGRAEETTQQALRATYYDERLPQKKLVSSATLNAQAQVTRAQLAIWHGVITNNPAVLPSTMDLLEFSDDLLDAGKYSAHAMVTAMEFAPVVLGRRANERYGLGWLGRTALCREDRRRSTHDYYVQGTRTHNWDLGLTYDSSYPLALQEPPHKVQSKLTNHKEQYREDISVSVAREVGTNNARVILMSCKKEQLGLTSEMQMSPAELDELTQTFENDFKRQGGTFQKAS